MKALATTTAAALAAQCVRPIVLVVFTTYTDRSAATVDKVYRFAAQPVLYDFGNTGTVQQFEPFLLGVSDLAESIDHIPQTTARGFDRELRITLANAPYRGGDLLIQELRAHHLTFARVEVATVYGSPGETGWYDLRALAGDEHVVEFRGEVVMPEGIDDDLFQVLCQSEEITVPWLRATDETTVDPKDLGQRLPAPFGASKRVPCVNLVVGWTTTFALPLAATVTAGGTLDVTDRTGFPIAAFTARANGEEIAVASRSAATDALVISARAQNGTEAVDHAAGTVILEVPAETVVAVAGYSVSDLAALYMENPYNGELFLVSQHTPDLADTTALSGETIATARFSQAQLRTLLDAAQEASRVAQQAEYTTAGTQEVDTHQPNAAGNIEVSDFATPLKTWSVSPTAPRVNFTDLSANGSNGEMRLTFGGLPSGITVLSARLVFNGTMDCTGVFGGSGVRFIRIYREGLPGFTNTFGDSPEFSANAVSSRSWVVAGSGGGWDLSAYNGSYLKMSANLPFAGANSSNYATLTSGWGLEITYEDGGGLATRIVDARIEGASVGFGLNFYADVDGPTVPKTYADAYTFDDVTSMSSSGCTLTSDSGAWKLAATETVHDAMDSASGWTTSGGCNVTADTGTKTQGTGSLRFENQTTWEANANLRGGYVHTVGPYDFSTGRIALDIYIPSNANTGSGYGYEYMSTVGLSLTTGIRLTLTSDNGTSWTNYKSWVFGRNHILAADGWYTLIFDPATFPLYSSGGTLDLSSVKGYEIGFLPTVANTACQFQVDRFREMPAEMVAQRNATTGTVDLEADGDEYQLSLKASSSTDLASGVVYFENTGGSGTTPPTSRRTLPFTPGDCGVGSFTSPALDPTDVGTPAYDDVETIGISVTLPASPPGAVIDVPTVWLDTLTIRDDSSSLYVGTVGSLIEKPPDVARWFLTVFCGQDAAYPDATTFGTAATNLAAIVMAGDFRTLGVTFPEVMARLGYECRSNFVRAEAAAGSRLKMLCAESDYGWPAASGDTLTEIGRLSEVGRDGRELATRFQFAYARDWSLGDSLEGYHGLVEANPTTSDVGTTNSALAALETLWGRRDAAAAVLLAHQAEAGAEDVAGYYVAEAIRDAGVLILAGCAWWQVPGIEVGDLRTVEPRWRSAPMTVRVIETIRRFNTGVVDVRGVEVT